MLKNQGGEANVPLQKNCSIKINACSSKLTIYIVQILKQYFCSSKLTIMLSKFCQKQSVKKMYLKFHQAVNVSLYSFESKQKSRI